MSRLRPSNLSLGRTPGIAPSCDDWERQRAWRQRSQQVHAHQVPPQLLSLRDAPIHGVEIALNRRAEEQPCWTFK